MKKRTKVIIGVIVALVIIAAIGGGAGGNKSQTTVEPTTPQEEVKAEPKNETVETTTETQEATNATEAEEPKAEPEAAEPVAEEPESLPSATEVDSLFSGELLDIVNNDGVVVIKAKISTSGSKEDTVKKNYFNIEDYVKNHDMEGVTEIQYWAVADMQNGEEDKVISFTVPADLIERISGGRYAANQMGNDVEELWIHPSLK